MNKENYNIAIKAKEITEKIGQPIIRETYYTDNKIGSEYSFDNLKIEYYFHWDTDLKEENSYVLIYIADTLLFSYNFCTKEEFWKNKNLVNTIGNAIYNIHKTIPGILQKREMQNRENKEKYDELKSLEESFKYYIECFNSKSKHKVLEFIKSELEERGMSCSAIKRSKLIYSSLAEYDHYSYYLVHVVYDSNVKVAAFNNNQFYVLPECYVEEFQPGNWTKEFKDIIRQARYYEDNFINNSIEDLIKKLR